MPVRRVGGGALTRKGRGSPSRVWLPTQFCAPIWGPAIAVDGKTLRGSFDAFADRKAAHMMSALRHADRIVLAHVMIAEKSNEIPAAPELIEALGLTDCLFTLDAEHCQKNCSNA